MSSDLRRWLNAVMLLDERATLDRLDELAKTEIIRSQSPEEHNLFTVAINPTPLMLLRMLKADKGQMVRFVTCGGEDIAVASAWDATHEEIYHALKSHAHPMRDQDCGRYVIMVPNEVRQSSLPLGDLHVVVSRAGGGGTIPYKWFPAALKRAIPEPVS